MRSYRVIKAFPSSFGLVPIRTTFIAGHNDTCPYSASFCDHALFLPPHTLANAEFFAPVLTPIEERYGMDCGDAEAIFANACKRAGLNRAWYGEATFGGPPLCVDYGVVSKPDQTLIDSRCTWASEREPCVYALRKPTEPDPWVDYGVVRKPTEPVPWKPKYNEAYNFVASGVTVAKATWRDDVWDRDYYAFGNCFHPETRLSQHGVHIDAARKAIALVLGAKGVAEWVVWNFGKRDDIKGIKVDFAEAQEILRRMEAE